MAAIRLTSNLRMATSRRVSLGWRVTRSVTTLSPTEAEAVRPFDDIPRMPRIPILGSTWAYLPFVGRYQVERMNEANFDKYKKYGKIVKEFFGNDTNRIVVWLFDPTDFETVYRNEGKLPRRLGFEALGIYRKMRPDWFSCGGLLYLQGKKWQEFRSKSQPYLMKPKLITNYLPSMNLVANEMIERMMVIKDPSSGNIDDFLDLSYKWALESVGLVALDHKLGCLKAKPLGDAHLMPKYIAEAIAAETEIDYKPIALWRFMGKPMGKVWSRYVTASDNFTEIAFKYVSEAMDRITSEEKPNVGKDASILEQLLARPDFDMKDAITMTIDMLLAGTDTSANSTTFALYNLGRNPEAQEKARKEINKVVGNEKEITSSMINEMRYLKACIKESHRLLPVVFGNNRLLAHDVVCSGYKIPKGTLVTVVNDVACRLEENFEDPLAYKPERWVDNKEHNPFLVLPFGFGPRSCIGRRIAEQEIMLLLAKIISNFEVQYKGPEIRTLTHVTTKPDKPISFTFTQK